MFRLFSCGRSADLPPGEKQTCTFYFQCTKPDSLGVDFAQSRTQTENVQAVLADILGHGNAENGTLLPGQLEADSAALSTKHGGLLFCSVEIAELLAYAEEGGGTSIERSDLKRVELRASDGPLFGGVTLDAKLDLDTPPIVNKPVF